MTTVFDKVFASYRSQIKNESKVVADFRRDSYDSFVKAGLPTRKLEDWKYTNIGFIDQVNWSRASKQETPGPDLSVLPKDCYKLVFVDGLLVGLHTK